MAVIGRIDIGHEAGRAAGRLRGGFAALIAPGRRKGAAARFGPVVRLVELGLVVLLGFAAVRLAMTAFAPLPIIETPPPPAPQASVEEGKAGNPFRTAAAPGLPIAAADAPEAAETLLDLSLHGTWVDEQGGSAVIKLPGGEQKTFFVGDAICCGARLERVLPDHVVISRGGVRETLRLADKTASAPRRIEPVQRSQRAAPSPRISGGRQKLLDIVQMQPMQIADGTYRLQLLPAGDKTAFESLGFRSGDILVSINGAPASANLNELNQLLASLEGASTIVVGVQRGEANLSFDVPLGGAQAVTQ